MLVFNIGKATSGSTAGLASSKVTSNNTLLVRFHFDLQFDLHLHIHLDLDSTFMHSHAKSYAHIVMDAIARRVRAV